MFTFFTHNIKKMYASLQAKLSPLFAIKPDEHTLKKIEHLLLEADMGTKTTQLIIEKLQHAWRQGGLSQGADLKQALKTILRELVEHPYDDVSTTVFLLVGINGSGKTTAAGKVAYKFVQQGKKVLLVAADTFRAAAVEQLTQWASRVGADVYKGNPGQEAASVVFQGCQVFLDGAYDILIIDTAGRLQTKTHLMQELEKIGRILDKKMPNANKKTVLTIDAMLGQNSLDQARIFHAATHLDGVILTKVDGTGKGGVVVTITHELSIPIAYISCGEKVQDLLPFDAGTFVDTLVGA